MPTVHRDLLPRHVGARVRGAAIASLIAEILLVGTGAAVRLTGSGLGCPTWPRCTTGSFTTTPAMGAHGLIEFGNRLLTFVLVVVAIAAFVAVLRLRRDRRDLFALALAQVLSIPAQAVLGGITVLTGLNPWVVGAHFLFSLALIVLMTIFVHRTRTVPGRRTSVVSPLLGRAAVALGLFAAVVLALGVTTTGSGPHAGDANAPRNGLDPVALAGVHETAAWGLLILTVVLLLAVRRMPGLRRRAVLLLCVEGAQIAVGRGKDQFDKRETIKRRETERDMQRALREVNR